LLGRGAGSLDPRRLSEARKSDALRDRACLPPSARGERFFFLLSAFLNWIWTSRNRFAWQLGAIEQLLSAKKKPISLKSTKNNLIGKLCKKNNAQIQNQQNYSQ
jgi:hypothetical protein